MSSNAVAKVGSSEPLSTIGAPHQERLIGVVAQPSVAQVAHGIAEEAADLDRLQHAERLQGDGLLRSGGRAVLVVQLQLHMGGRGVRVHCAPVRAPAGRKRSQRIGAGLELDDDAFQLRGRGLQAGYELPERSTLLRGQLVGVDALRGHEIVVGSEPDRSQGGAAAEHRLHGVIKHHLRTLGNGQRLRSHAAVVRMTVDPTRRQIARGDGDVLVERRIEDGGIGEEPVRLPADREIRVLRLTRMLPRPSKAAATARLARASVSSVGELTGDDNRRVRGDG